MVVELSLHPSQLKLQATLEVSKVGLEGLLHHNLLGGEARSEFYSVSSRPQSAHTARLEVDNVGKSLLSSWSNIAPSDCQLHHLPCEQSGSVGDEQSTYALSSKSTHRQGFRVICGNKVQQTT